MSVGPRFARLPLQILRESHLARPLHSPPTMTTQTKQTAKQTAALVREHLAAGRTDRAFEAFEAYVSAGTTDRAVSHRLGQLLNLGLGVYGHEVRDERPRPAGPGTTYHWTKAPEAYDYGCTRTLASAPDKDGTEWRLVSIDPTLIGGSFHVGQVQRYWSGLHATWDVDSEDSRYLGLPSLTDALRGLQ